MHYLERLSRFAAWLKNEHLKNLSMEETYNNLSKNAGYDQIVNFDKRKTSLEKLLQGLTLTDKTVLDLACGSGAFISAVLTKNPKTVIGVDITEGMLNLAKERFKENTNVTLINKSFMDVDFNEESFDLIVMANASRYIPTSMEEKFFSNITKWLKKDGVFIIHSDFWRGIVGHIMAPIVLNFTNSSNVNPKTTFDWTLEKELRKYFDVYAKAPLGGSIGLTNHEVFFARKLRNQK
jgi:ubiquinone/menaquinone biosynthesis C-methylase UbiE